MADNECYKLNDFDESMSFNDWCVNSNFQDYDNVNQLKADNFNLRLRCYNLDNELNKCTCRVGGNKSDESIRGSFGNRNQILKFIDTQNDLIEKNARLLKNNEKMKEKLAYLQKYELQISEIESMKYKYEQLNKLFNEKAPMNELIQEMMQYNDNLIKSNVTAQHKVFNLELNLANVQQHKLTDEKMLAKSQDLNSQHHSSLMKEFNESLVLSKAVSVGCIECNVYKANYEHLYERFVKSVEKQESNANLLQLKDRHIKDLEQQIESLKSEPEIDQTKMNKYKLLIEKSLESVVKKDLEKKALEQDTKKLVEYYVTQLGKLHRQVDLLMEPDETEAVVQNDMLGSLYILLRGSLNGLHVPDNNEYLKQLNKLLIKLANFNDVKTTAVKNKSLLLVDIIRIMCQYFTNKYSSVTNTSRMNETMEERFTFDKRNESTDSRTQIAKTPLQLVIDKYEEVKDLSNRLLETSFSLNETRKELSLRQNRRTLVNESGELTSPSVRIDNEKKNASKCQASSDNSSSLYFDNALLDLTAYQSTAGDEQFPDIFTTPLFETMMEKIRELGEIIHQYSELVKNADVDEDVSILKSDKSCLANSVIEADKTFVPSDRSINLDSSPTESVSQDPDHKLSNGSYLKNLYHQERDEYDHLIKEKQDIIDHLLSDLDTIKRQNFENIFNLNMKFEEVHSKYNISDCRVKELELVIETYKDQISHDQQCMVHLRAQISESEQEIKTQQEVIAGIQCRLTESIQRTECAESHLAQTIKGIGEYETNVCNLQSANMKLSDQIKELCAATNRLTVENSRLTSDVEDISTSLLKVTRSLETMTEEKELIANKVTNLCKKVLPTLKNDDDDIMINDIGGMLEYLEKQWCNAPSRANSSSWATSISNTISSLGTSEKNYYESGLEYRNNLEQKIGDNIFSDITNVTSLNTDKIMAEGARNKPDMMTGFKISTIEDVIGNPDKVLVFLRQCMKSIVDLKRRLKMRYEENQNLKRAIDAAYTSQMCQSLTKQVDILKTECAINNENVVKVVKRKSKK